MTNLYYNNYFKINEIISFFFNLLSILTTNNFKIAYMNEQSLNEVNTLRLKCKYLFLPDQKKIIATNIEIHY